ncbi:MAG: nitroreductase/quinone reductase family protein [Anaerolineaceae bacterium]
MWFNPIMTWLLRSPFHKIMSGSTLLVTVTGRKSKHPITTPVNYLRAGKILWVVSARDRTWWRNLTGGAALTVTLARKERHARGEVILHEKEVVHAMTEYFKLAPRVAKYYKVKLAADGSPNLADLGAAARQRVMIKITIL